MSDERKPEVAGEPVEQNEVTDTQVQAAVSRAADGGAPVADTVESPAVVGSAERPFIAPISDPPSASEGASASDLFVAKPAEPTAEAPHIAAPVVVEQPDGVPTSQARDGEIRIDANHPMAALYMQSPMPPEIRGNRGAGVLISLLATIAFALLYTGVIALWQAPNFPPSTFLNDGLLPWVLNWGFAGAVIGFFISLVLLVLIVGRAGWWAYVLGGLPVGILVWVTALFSLALSLQLQGEPISWNIIALTQELGLFVPVIAAAIIAREVTIWFGAWIGARGRKVARENAEALEEYEEALAQVQAG